MKRPEEMTRQELEDEVAYLRGEFALGLQADIIDAIKRRFNLLPCAARLLWALYSAKGRPLSAAQLHDHLPNVWRSDDQSESYVKSVVCRVRKGIGHEAVATLYAAGYAITPHGMAQVESALVTHRRAA